MKIERIYNKVSREVSCVVCLFLFALLPLTAAAQASLKATIEPIEMMIGEQATLTLTVEAAEGASVQWPTWQPRQMLVPGVEVLATQSSKPSATTSVLTVTLTSFDGNLYPLPPLKVKVNGKELKSNELALKVVEMEVDTTQMNKFYGPKDVQQNPFQWSDWSTAFWLSVLMLLLIAVTYYLYTRLRAGKPIIAHIKIVKRLLPHQKAMKEIEQIKADRMAIAENQKEYYTKLTDTLRRYIEERYGFSAMEMTSTEIIERLMANADEQRLDELRQLFTTADLVKFAKFSALTNENDANLVSAIDFINQTKLEGQPTEEVVKPQLSEEDQRSKKQRTWLRILIGVLSVMVVALFVYVLYQLWLLVG